MGRARNKRMRTTKNKTYSKLMATANRRRDIDQIQDDIKNGDSGKPLVFDADNSEDLPGLGQFYCVPCARHFADAVTLETHNQSKLHRRRIKDVTQEQFSQAESDRAAGKSKEILPSVQALRQAVAAT